MCLRIVLDYLAVIGSRLDCNFISDTELASFWWADVQVNLDGYVSCA